MILKRPLTISMVLKRSLIISMVFEETIECFWHFIGTIDINGFWVMLPLVTMVFNGPFG